MLEWNFIIDLVDTIYVIFYRLLAFYVRDLSKHVSGKTCCVIDYSIVVRMPYHVYREQSTIFMLTESIHSIHNAIAIRDLYYCRS